MHRLERKIRHGMQKISVKLTLDTERDNAKAALASAEACNNAMVAKMNRVTGADTNLSTALQQLQAPAA